MDMHKF